jgi:hypothetical protein
MRFRLLILVAFVTAAVCLWGFLLDAPKPSLLFVCYTNDVPGVRRDYAIPEPSDHSTALFRFSNKARHPLFCRRYDIQLHTATGWVDDKAWRCLNNPDVEVGAEQAMLVDFRTPAGSNAWRCSVQVDERRWHRLYWYLSELEYKTHLNLHLRRNYVVWSPEVVR